MFNRFIWNIGFLARNGFYILIDNREWTFLPAEARHFKPMCHTTTFADIICFSLSQNSLQTLMLLAADLQFDQTVYDDHAAWLLVRTSCDVALEGLQHTPRLGIVLLVHRSTCVNAHAHNDSFASQSVYGAPYAEPVAMLMCASQRAVSSHAGLEAHHDDHRPGPGVQGARHVRHLE